MSNSNQHVRERQRLDFAKIQSAIQIPNLIEVQMKSYQRFLQMDLLPSERDDGGLQSVFTSVFPIRDFREMSQLEFVDRSEEHTSELQSQSNLVCRLLLEKKNISTKHRYIRQQHQAQS